MGRLALLALSAVVMFLVIRNLADDGDQPGVDASNDPAAATATTAAPAAAAGPAGGQQAQLNAGGQDLFQLASGGGLASRAGQRAQGRGVTVESVVADEGFWVGQPGRRVFVFLTPQARTRAGDRQPPVLTPRRCSRRAAAVEAVNVAGTVRPVTSGRQRPSFGVDPSWERGIADIYATTPAGSGRVVNAAWSKVRPPHHRSNRHRRRRVRSQFLKGQVKEAPNAEADSQLAQDDDRLFPLRHRLEEPHADRQRDMIRSLAAESTDDAMTRSEEGGRDHPSRGVKLRKVDAERVEHRATAHEEVHIEPPPLTDGNLQASWPAPRSPKPIYRDRPAAQEEAVANTRAVGRRIRAEKDRHRRKQITAELRRRSRGQHPTRENEEGRT